MTPDERNAARAAIERDRNDEDCCRADSIALLTKALDALDARDALLRDVRDHVQQCCGCLTYGDWLDKIRAAIGEPQERLCECKTDRAVYPCKVGNLAGRYVCTECGEPTEPAPTASPS